MAMRTSAYIILSLCITFMLFACEEEFTPPNSGEGPKYVVEGFIEAGEDPLPPYLILTKTLDFYSEIGPDEFNNSFVHDATVRVSDGTIDVTFYEVCFSELDPATQEEIAEQFGFNPDSLTIDFCIYTDVVGLLNPQVGKTYNLFIQVGSDTITASTMIPNHVPLDSLMFQAPPGEPTDTLAQLRCFVEDPPGERNFYRYFMSVNDGPLETAFSSVEEDLFFDGKSFEFQLFNPETTTGDVEPGEFGLYFVGDTVTLKWCTMDQAHFDFWNTLEFSNANEGPFSSYTRIQSNIQGGLGIWGGYSVSYYTLIVEY